MPVLPAGPLPTHRRARATLHADALPGQRGAFCFRATHSEDGQSGRAQWLPAWRLQLALASIRRDPRIRSESGSSGAITTLALFAHALGHTPRVQKPCMPCAQLPQFCKQRPAAGSPAFAPAPLPAITLGARHETTSSTRPGRVRVQRCMRTSARRNYTHS